MRTCYERNIRANTIWGFWTLAASCVLAMLGLDASWQPMLLGSAGAFFAIGLVVLGWPYMKSLLIGLGAARTTFLFGILGTWISITVALAGALWMIRNGQAFAIGTAGIGVGAKEDEGPLQWVYSFSLEGGFGRNVFSLTFRGANTSKVPIKIKEANIISLVDGTLLPLEIAGVDPKTDENKVVAIDKVQLITPGAPIQLVAKFGPPDPNNPGKILGLDSKAFLEKWRQFSFNVKDDVRSYKLDFNENSLMPFFQGQVGPRVMIKPD